MRGKNLSFLAVALILLMVSLYVAFSGNQTLATPSPVECKIAGEGWDYGANGNLPPFDCCPGLRACPDGYCCEVESDERPMSGQIIGVALPEGDADPTSSGDGSEGAGSGEANPTGPPDVPVTTEPVFAEETSCTCSAAKDCGTDGWSGNPYCRDGDVYQDYSTFACRNPGTGYSYCSQLDRITKREDCGGAGCSGGQCASLDAGSGTIPPEYECHEDQDCGTDGWTGDPYCRDGDVWRDRDSYDCQNPGESGAYCTKTTKSMMTEDCSQGCEGGECSSGVVILNVECYDDDDCGTDGWLGQEYCTSGGGENTDVADTWRTHTCNNPGITSAYCTNASEDKVKEDCGDSQCTGWSDPYCYDGDVYRWRDCTWRGCDSYGCYAVSGIDAEKIEECGTMICQDGQCVDIACEQDSDCGTDGWTGNPYCSGGDVWQSWRTYECQNAGTADASCTHSDQDKKKEECGTMICQDGQCVSGNVECYEDQDCGTDGWTGGPYCKDGDVWQIWMSYTCHNPGQTSSYCSESEQEEMREDCGSKACQDGQCVTESNSPPSIDSYSPQSNPTIDVGGSQAFSITKSDPDGDPLTVKWFVDGAKKSEGSDSYTYTSVSAGTFGIRVEVSDGKDTASHEWTLTVKQTIQLMPDLEIFGLRKVAPDVPRAGGDTVEFDFYVKNTGKKVADNVKIKVLSGESNWDSQPMSLNAGEQMHFTYDHVYSQSGTYTVTAIVDPDDLISEYSEDNNEMSVQVEITSKKGKGRI